MMVRKNFETDIKCGNIYRHKLVYINLKKVEIAKISHLNIQNQESEHMSGFSMLKIQTLNILCIASSPYLDFAL